MILMGAALHLSQQFTPNCILSFKRVKDVLLITPLVCSSLKGTASVWLGEKECISRPFPCDYYVTEKDKTSSHLLNLCESLAEARE